MSSQDALVVFVGVATVVQHLRDGHGLGWRMLEERRGRENVLIGRRCENMVKNHWQKLIVKKLQEAGGVGWREEHEMLMRRYGLEQEDEGQAGSAAEWKRRVRELNGSEWREEVEAMSSLRWCRAVKDTFGVEKYVASWEGYEVIRLRFRLRTGSAGLLEDTDVGG